MKTCPECGIEMTTRWMRCWPCHRKKYPRDSETYCVSPRHNSLVEDLIPKAKHDEPYCSTCQDYYNVSDELIQRTKQQLAKLLKTLA